jgi:hypothetical protein
MRHGFLQAVSPSTSGSAAFSSGSRRLQILALKGIFDAVVHDART